MMKLVHALIGVDSFHSCCGGVAAYCNAAAHGLAWVLLVPFTVAMNLSVSRTQYSIL